MIFERGTGLLPSKPDIRDYSIYNPIVKPFFDKIGVTNFIQNPLTIPTYVDNRELCSPVEDQLILNSCVAHSSSSTFEYLENLLYNSQHNSQQSYTDASRLYLYKRSRILGGIKGDGGCYTRDVLKVMSSYGAPPESCWSYNILSYDDDPSQHPYCDIVAPNYKVINYVRLDINQDDQTYQNQNQNQILINIKANIAAKQPVITGIDLYAIIYATIPGIGDYYYPCDFDSVLSRHSMLIVGYDDNRIITNPFCNEKTTTGAFLAKNSYGILFGIGGYCWIPYDFLLNSPPKMYDIWTITEIIAPKNINIQEPIDWTWLYALGFVTGIILLSKLSNYKN